MGRFTESKITMAQTGDYVLVTLRIDRENQMFARLASETIVEKCLHLYMMMKTE